MFRLVAILLALLPTIVLAQTSDTSGNINTTVAEHQVLTIAEKMPAPSYKIQEYLDSNIHYPKDAENAFIEGRVIVKYIVRKDGNIDSIHVVKSVYPSLDTEAVRVVRTMPIWQAGLQNGQPIDVYYTLPIPFRLNVFQYVEQMPEPTYDVFRYLKKNIIKPDIPASEQPKNRTVVNFIVNESGKIVNPKLREPVHPLLEKELFRVFTSMPAWKPGIQNGKKVSVYFNIPVDFLYQ